MPAANVRYSAPAILLHWLMALLLAGLFGMGLYMANLQLSPWKLKIYSWHKWAGVTAFMLLLLRLAWRFIRRPPPLPDGMSRSLRFAAHASHVLLYLLMIAIPLTGWLLSSAKGFQTVYFGVLPIPDLLSKNKELGELLRVLHEMLNFFLAGLVLVHLCASLKHHWLKRDGVLTRMLPFN